MNDPGVCILVLNWNGADDTLECLRSLQKITYSNAQVVVIDNGSSDDSVARIQADFPHIHILKLESNLLYGGGNNAGLKWAAENDFKYVVFLNNDTIVEPDFLEPLLAAFDEHENVGMVAPLMCYMADPQQVWYGGGIVNLWTGVVAHRHIRESVKAVDPKPAVTDYITGCCMMMPTTLASQLKGFDPFFKMYGEDVDLSLRCRAAGYQLIFTSQSKIYHKVSASLGGEFGLAKMVRKGVGLLKLYKRYSPWYYWPTIVIAQVFYTFIAGLNLFALKLKSSTKKNQL